MKVKIKISLFILALLFLTNWLSAQRICNNKTGKHNGFTYEYWKDSGSGCMELGSGATFSVDWSNINNLLARIGVRPGSKKQKVTYDIDYRPQGNSYMCIYGWTKSPLIEYYIIDSWGTWRPPGGKGFVGTVKSDGGTYDIYKTQRVNKPSIVGNTTFYQYWSVRQKKRTSGTITCANHFKAWESHGMKMGNFYEVSFCVEGWQSKGSAKIKKLDFGTGSATSGTPEPTPEPTAVPGPVNAYGRIEAEKFIAMEGVEIENNTVIGYIQKGDYSAYTIDFPNGASKLEVYAASATSGGKIEVRQDNRNGKLLGTINISGTGGWSTRKSFSGNVSNVQGRKKIYMVYTGGNDYLFNIDWFKFSKSGSNSTPKPTGNKGDVNSDNTVNIVDALLTAQYYVGANPSNFKKENADTNCDGTVNIVDALLMAQYYVKTITQFCK